MCTCMHARTHACIHNAYIYNCITHGSRPVVHYRSATTAICPCIIGRQAMLEASMKDLVHGSLCIAPIMIVVIPLRTSRLHAHAIIMKCHWTYTWS